MAASSACITYLLSFPGNMPTTAALRRLRFWNRRALRMPRSPGFR
ncbi:hypothetical protein BRI6_4106 [plant metagenome]|uniref:Uncharacterized protein n=1 Tax=plant metagenome TaxID=1297885 RepID=A0A484S2E9_9ZZZZ